MTRTVINLIHKSQGFDKIIPLLMKLRREIDEPVRIVSVLHLEERSANQLDEFLQDGLVEVSDSLVIVGKCGFSSNLEVLARDAQVEFHAFPDLPFRSAGKAARAFASGAVTILKHPQSCSRLFFLLRRECSKTTWLFTIQNAGSIFLCRMIIDYLKRRGGLIIGYLKSIHDQGLGLSALKSVDSDVQKPKGKAEDRIDWHRLDFLLVPTGAFKTLFPSRAAQVAVSGYPPFYSEWREFIEGRLDEKRDECDQTRVLVFTRGPSPSARPEDQIITDETLERLLRDIAECCEAVFPSYRIFLKPHPYQEMHILERFAAENSRVTIVSECPALASGKADIAIASYSSAIIDACIWGIPLIEYYQINDAFRRLHPDGSPFGQFGVHVSRTRSELLSALEGVRDSHGQGRSSMVVRRVERNDWLGADHVGNRCFRVLTDA